VRTYRSPAQGADELRWLAGFLAIRRAHLAHAADPATREEWAASVSRADALGQLVTAKNTNLTGKITFPGTDYSGVDVP
jgi:hypothetical protein